jgi:hypothetical protein
MKKALPLILIFCMLITIDVSDAFAQSANELKLGLSRDFGYGGFNNDIQGTFTLHINNPPANIVRVAFFVDTTPMGEVTQPPFNLQFNTDSYPLGAHTLSAIGYTADGKEINSNKIQSQFVPASAGTQTVAKILIPILAILVLMVVISIGLPLLLSKGKLANLPLGEPRNYGVGGGAVCPKCSRPFPLRLWWINLGLKKIGRCPYCGKWSFVRPSSLSELRTAEAAEPTLSQQATTITGETEAEKLKKEMDDSRFQNM